MQVIFLFFFVGIWHMYYIIPKCLVVYFFADILSQNMNSFLEKFNDGGGGCPTPSTHM